MKDIYNKAQLLKAEAKETLLQSYGLRDIEVCVFINVMSNLWDIYTQKFIYWHFRIYFGP